MIRSRDFNMIKNKSQRPKLIYDKFQNPDLRSLFLILKLKILSQNFTSIYQTLIATNQENKTLYIMLKV